MANGGRFHCLSCVFNETEKQLLAARNNKQKELVAQIETDFTDKGFYCSLRKQLLKGDPLWTSCDHQIHVCFPSSEIKEMVSIREKISHGTIFQLGSAGVVPKIPWTGLKEPLRTSKGTCFICKRKIDYGVMVELENEKKLSFCCYRHYVRWWKTQYKDNFIKEEDYYDPDETKEK